MNESAPVAIHFGAGSDRVHTRADLIGDAAASVLGNSFHVYGVKDVGGTVRTVFPDYTITYGAATGWQYAGLLSYPSQTIHYWDFSAQNFIFQAWSPTTGAAAVTVTSPTTLTVDAPTADDLASLYIADLTDIKRSDATPANSYGQTVTLTFRNMATKVRFGIYETVQGYSISEMTFRSAGGRFTKSNSNALLDGTFNAADAATGGTFYVTYNATTSRAEMATGTSHTVADYHDFGTFAQTAIGTDSSNPTWAGGTAAYHTVLPNEDNVGEMTLYVDFTMTPTDGSSEDILYVKGAHVTVPASFMVWHPNYAYTYLFKITQNVNGTTGEEGTDPVNLYPITFDAIIQETDAGNTYETELKN